MTTMVHCVSALVYQPVYISSCISAWVNQPEYISPGISAWVYQPGYISLCISAWVYQPGYIRLGISAWVYQPEYISLDISAQVYQLKYISRVWYISSHLFWQTQGSGLAPCCCFYYISYSGRTTYEQWWGRVAGNMHQGHLMSWSGKYRFWWKT